MADRNLAFGLFLTFFGGALSLGSYLLIGNVPLTAMGIGLTVLGAAWALTPPNPLPKNAVQRLVKSSCSNIEALLEGLGAFEKAIYIPRKKGGIAAYVPLKKAGEAMLSEIAENVGKLVFKRGGSLGVIIMPPNPALSNTQSGELQDVYSLLEHALVESEVAEAVKAVVDDNFVTVDVEKPNLDIEYPRFRLVMGSIPASLAAQAVAWALSKPVQVEWEKRNVNRLTVRLRVLEWTDKAFT